MSVPERFRKIVGGGALYAGAVGVPGAFAFGADVPILISIWCIGGVMIASEAGNVTTKDHFKGIATSTLSGAALFLAGSKFAASLFNLLPGPGTMAAIGVNSSLNAFFTYRFLRSVAKVYDKFDTEELIMQNLLSLASLFSIFDIGSDVADMMDCMKDGAQLKDCFRE